MRKIASTLILFITLGTLYAQTVTLTFTGRGSDNRYVRLNRVVVNNLTRNWQEVIYWPDTTLTMTNSSDVHEYDHEEGFRLSQNTPNPFAGVTDVFLSLDEAGETSLQVYDMNGKQVALFSGFLAKGGHNFRISLTTAQTYLLKARNGSHTANIKMINNGSAGHNSITYIGENSPIIVTLKSTTDRPFAYGDIMQYVGYGTVDGTELESSHIVQAQNSSQMFTLQFTIHNPPTVTTSIATNITDISATCGGTINSDGGSTVTTRGVCWGTSQNPTLSNSHTSNGSGTGIFTANITGLTPSTTYYVRAYATNSVGTTYGNQETFTTESMAQDGQPCPGFQTVTDYDGNTYNTVRIGYQCWMKENLRTEHYADGTEIPLSNSYNDNSAFRCYPNESYYNVALYGYLYNWPAAINISSTSSSASIDVQGICPNGWHLPSDMEWMQLTQYVSSKNQYCCSNNNLYIAKALASTSNWLYTSGDYYHLCDLGYTPSNNNATGFCALPAGHTQNPNSFGKEARFWSSTETSEGGVWHRSLNTDSATVWRWLANKSFFQSIRCIKYASDYIDSMPTVTTNMATSITTTSCICGGNVTSSGGAQVTARGICWSTSQNPTTFSNYTTEGNGTGSFTSNITGLTLGTTYYVRAYASNIYGTAYGQIITFQTDTDGHPCIGVPTVTDYDGNTYNTVQIGNQCWMKENLRAEHFANGTLIPLGTALSSTEAYRYNFPTSDIPFEQRGYLYNWSAVMHGASSSSINPSGVQGICPYGWHVPSDAEWTQLTDYVSGQSSYWCLNISQHYGKALAATSYWSNYSYSYGNHSCVIGYDQSTNNATGFSAIPTGSLSGNSVGNNTIFWSSSKTGDNAIYRWLSYSATYMTYGNCSDCTGTVRCVKSSLPTVVTNAVTSVTNYSASCGGEVTSTGGGEVTTRGVCYSTSQNPTVNNSYISNGSGTGSFTCYMTNLTAGTTYYVRAYATNDVGTAYGEQVSFTTTNASLPTVSTNSITGISSSTATGGGNVTSNGGSPVTARGVCWNLSQNPTVGNNCTTDGSGTGSFTSNMTYLAAGATYYVRAYAINNAGTAYGNQVSFTTLPSITTKNVSNVTSTSAMCGGQVYALEESSLIARGVCWSTSQNPTVSNSHTTDGNGNGSFTSSITGLVAGTTYYVRAYATNNTGTAYGAQESFVTTSPFDGQPCPGASTVTDYDGNNYNTVQIGNQCWMKENLRTTHYTDGTSIYAEGSSSTYPRYYDYSSSGIVLESRGYLYNWPAVMHDANSSTANPSGVQGICPTGWHVPSHAEWTQLTDYVSGKSQYVCNTNNSYIAKALASTTGWNSSTYTCSVGNTQNSNNATGFSAVPAGYNNGPYVFAGSSTLFWSCSESNADNGMVETRLLEYDASYMSNYIFAKNYGLSVRCLKNEGSSSTQMPTVTTNVVGNISATSATCGGNVTSSGGSNVTARGVCWSASQNPTVSNSHTTNDSGTGSFTSSITGLTAGTTYYVRAYATNSAGTAYGEQRSFTTSGGNFSQDGQPCTGAATVTDYDGNTYNTVQIGNQCWMKENLRTTHYSDGASIPAGGSSSSSTSPYYYNYSASSIPLAQRGYLYNWPVVMHGASSSSSNPSGVQGICPTGWHMPSDAEWTQLTDYVSSQSGYLCSTVNTSIAKALSSTTEWNTSTNACAVGNNQSANNVTGFGAFPASYYYNGYGDIGAAARFWSATESSTSGAWNRGLYSSSTYVGRGSSGKSYGFSVRCLKD